MGTETTQRPSAYPDGSPDLWFVEAVPYTIELVRYFKGRTTSELAQQVLGSLMADLEMQETGALDLVRNICQETEKRTAFEKLLTSEQVAHWLRIKPCTLERWRAKGDGPAFVKLNEGQRCLVRYRRATVEAYLDDCKRSSTKDPG